MRTYRKSIIILLVISLLIPSLFGSAQADDNLIAIRRAYFKSTGLQWEDASPEAQQKFMRIFERVDQARVKAEVRRERALAKAEQQKIRGKRLEQKQLTNMERAYLRQKRNEEAQIMREKRQREKKMNDMKKKMAKQRAKSRR